MSDSKPPIIVQQNLPVSVNEAWQAITQVDQMRQWFFENIESFVPEEGFETQFNVKTPNRDFLHQWKLTTVSPPQKITYQWTYPDYPGTGFVTFELQEKAPSLTLLTLTAEGMDSFPQDIPEFSRESCTAGWNYFIRERLKAYIDKNTGRSN